MINRNRIYRLGNRQSIILVLIYLTMPTYNTFKWNCYNSRSNILFGPCLKKKNPLTYNHGRVIQMHCVDSSNKSEGLMYLRVRIDSRRI